MAVKSLIPESNLLYPLLFGKQKQGIRANMALCDLICTYWKKQGNPATGVSMIEHLENLIHNPDSFEWFIRSLVGDEVYTGIKNGGNLVISIDQDTGKAYYMLASDEHLHEVDERTPEQISRPKAGNSLQELYDKYMYLASPSMREGLDNDNEVLLSLLGHCVEGGLL